MKSSPHRGIHSTRTPSRSLTTAPNAQRFIAVTSREPSDTQGKLMSMESRKRVGAEAGTGEEAKLPGEAHTKASEKAAVSYPIILRSHEPVADLDERLRRISRYLASRRWTSERPGTSLHTLRDAGHQRVGRAALGDGSWGQVRGFPGSLRVLKGGVATSGQTRRNAGKAR